MTESTDTRLLLWRAKGIDWLGRTAAFVAVASVLSYAFGWLLMRAYCDAIDAPWHLASVPSQRIIAEGYTTLLTLGLGAVVTWAQMHRGRSSRSADIESIVVTGIGCALLTVSYLADRGSGTRAITSSLGQYILTFGAGATIGEMAWGFGVGNYAWGTRNTWIAYLTWTVLATWIPSEAAGLRAERDSSPAISTLPTVTGPGLSGDWRLVDIIGDSALAMQLRASAPRAGVGVVSKAVPSAFVTLKLGDPGIRIVPPQPAAQASAPPAAAPMASTSAPQP